MRRVLTHARFNESDYGVSETPNLTSTSLQVTNLFVLFFLDYEHAAIGIAILTVLTIYLIFRGPAVQWGDISQELMFHQVRKYLLLIRDDPDPK